jgi:hypothetical protein
MNLLRWLLVVPAACIGYLVCFGCMAALLPLAREFCPPELLVSGQCMASWYPFAIDLATCVSTALGAATTVAVPFFIAPSHRPAVAIAAFAGGSVFVLWLLSFLGSAVALPVVSALGGGGLVMAWLVLHGARMANAARSSP